MLLFGEELLRAGWHYKEESSFHTAFDPKKNPDGSLPFDCNMLCHCAEHALGQRLGMPVHIATLPGHMYMCLADGTAFEMTGIGQPHFISSHMEQAKFFDVDIETEKRNGHFSPLSLREVDANIAGNVLNSVVVQEDASLEVLHAASLRGELFIKEYGPQPTIVSNTYISHVLLVQNSVYNNLHLDSEFHAQRMRVLLEEYSHVLEPIHNHNVLLHYFAAQSAKDE